MQEPAIKIKPGYLPITKFIQCGLLMDLISLILVITLAPILLSLVF
ncbi:MAG: hypothetical protein HY652_07480 [Acidobacteria bacterium]|nr:hypothetical protein [Acidobacteriota bacterium]